MAEKRLIDVREGYSGAGSDVWFWADALEPDDDLRPLWETIPGLPQQAVEKRYDPDQPRWSEGDPRGGQWKPANGAGGTEGMSWRKHPLGAITATTGEPALTEAQVTTVASEVHYVQQHGLENGTEMLLVLDHNGKRLSRTIGDHESVGDLGAIYSPSAAYSIHNHPSSNSFSDADIMTFLSTIPNHMIVIGHDGTLCVASKRPGLPQLRPWVGGEMPEDYAKARETIEEIRNKVMSNVFRDFQSRVLKGEISAEQASKEHSHLNNIEWAKALGYDYRRYDNA